MSNGFGFLYKLNTARTRVAFASKCPECGSRLLVKGLFGGDLDWLYNEEFLKCHSSRFLY